MSSVRARIRVLSMHAMLQALPYGLVTLHYSSLNEDTRASLKNAGQIVQEAVGGFVRL